MCLTKVYHNTYMDGAEDITEKFYPCRDGHCSHPDIRRYDRKFPFNRLSDIKGDAHRSHSKSFSSRRNSRVHLSGSSEYDYLLDPYDPSYDDDLYGYRGRDRHRSLKRSSTAPQIIYLDRDPSGDKLSRSRSRSSSRDIPLGPVSLAEEYARRHHDTKFSRKSRSSSHDPAYSRRRTDDPVADGYTLISDADERRHRHRRKHRRNSTSDYYPELTTTTTTVSSAPDPDYAYSSSYPRHHRRRSSSVVVHNPTTTVVDDDDHDAAATTTSPRPAKHLRWEDQLQRKRERQNAEIASRAGGASYYSSSGLSGSTLYTTAPDPTSAAISSTSPPKGILKHTETTSSKSAKKGKAPELEDEIEALRRSIERMESSRGKDRMPRSYAKEEDDWLSVDRDGEVWDYGYSGGRRKRGKMYY
ncbi:hypothetical protein VTJ04DRAFT_3928 [Mycothermus thermophilus]|uniref:uncharacterized protein n=1 Tax=Humicola insolens TaxID=85995 RepID=UPI0037431002